MNDPKNNGYAWAFEQQDIWNEIANEKKGQLDDILNTHLDWFTNHNTVSKLRSWKRPHYDTKKKSEGVNDSSNQSNSKTRETPLTQSDQLESQSESLAQLNHSQTADKSLDQTNRSETQVDSMTHVDQVEAQNETASTKHLEIQDDESLPETNKNETNYKSITTVWQSEDQEDLEPQAKQIESQDEIAPNVRVKTQEESMPDVSRNGTQSESTSSTNQTEERKESLTPAKQFESQEEIPPTNQLETQCDSILETGPYESPSALIVSDIQPKDRERLSPQVPQSEDQEEPLSQVQQPESRDDSMENNIHINSTTTISDKSSLIEPKQTIETTSTTELDGMDYDEQEDEIQLVVSKRVSVDLTSTSTTTEKPTTSPIKSPSSPLSHKSPRQHSTFMSRLFRLGRPSIGKTTTTSKEESSPKRTSQQLSLDDPLSNQSDIQVSDFMPERTLKHPRLLLKQKTKEQPLEELAEENNANIPSWAFGPELTKNLQNQSKLDPDKIFGQLQPYHVKDIFPSLK